jgi:hypothetical protein
VELVLPQPEALTATPPPRSRQRNRGGRSSPTRKRQRASGRASGRAAERRVVGWVQVRTHLISLVSKRLEKGLMREVLHWVQLEWTETAVRFEDTCSRSRTSASIHPTAPVLDTSPNCVFNPTLNYTSPS